MPSVPNMPRRLLGASALAFKLSVGPATQRVRKDTTRQVSTKRVQNEYDRTPNHRKDLARKGGVRTDERSPLADSVVRHEL